MNGPHRRAILMLPASPKGIFWLLTATMWQNLEGVNSFRAEIPSVTVTLVFCSNNRKLCQQIDHYVTALPSTYITYLWINHHHHYDFLCVSAVPQIVTACIRKIRLGLYVLSLTQFVWFLTLQTHRMQSRLLGNEHGLLSSSGTQNHVLPCRSSACALYIWKADSSEFCGAEMKEDWMHTPWQPPRHTH